LQIRQGIFANRLVRKQQAGWTSPLVMGLIQVGTISASSLSAGGRAAMQVMPFWTRDCLMATTMFMQTNLRFG
jgi:hypothetical protein